MSSTPLGTRIRELRGKRLMLQRDLAYQVGLKRNTMTQIESGRDIPSALTICKIAEVLHADANELLCLAGKVPTNLKERMAGNALLAELIRDCSLAVEKATAAMEASMEEEYLDEGVFQVNECDSFQSHVVSDEDAGITCVIIAVMNVITYKEVSV